MKELQFPIVLISLGLVLAACGSAQPVDGSIAVDTNSSPTLGNNEATTSSDLSWLVGQSREDGQGSVTVTITPQGIDEVADSIEFDVVMDTHSVELNMDLPSLSTLTTDTGLTVNGMAWTGELGGHHVEGILSFPASVDGVSLLDGATRLTLTIRNVDAAERSFSWQAGS